MFLSWRPPYCPRERRRRQRPDRCKKLQEKLRKVQEQERRRTQAAQERRRAHEHERRKLQEHDRSSEEQDRRRGQDQERRRGHEQERGSSREHDGHMQWSKPSSMRSLTPSQSSEEGIIQSCGIAEMLNPDNLTTGMKIAAAAVLLLLLYLLFRRGSSQFCSVCLPDVWYGIKDFIDMIIGAIKTTIIEIISFDGSCFSPCLQEILSLTWKYVF